METGGTNDNHLRSKQASNTTQSFTNHQPASDVIVNFEIVLLENGFGNNLKYIIV